MEKLIDNLLESIFGGVNVKINVIVGALLLKVGIIVHSLAGNQSLKAK